MQILNGLSDQAKIDFFATEWLNEDPNILRLPYVKITGSGTGPYSASLYDPLSSSKVRHLITGPIVLENVGVDAVGVRANREKIFKMRLRELINYCKHPGGPLRKRGWGVSADCADG